MSDIEEVSGFEFRGVDLVAAGVPCPPFSIAGKQLGAGDERDLFPQALRIIEEAEPAAVMLENVAGFASAKFSEYRANLFRKLDRTRLQNRVADAKRVRLWGGAAATSICSRRFEVQVLQQFRMAVADDARGNSWNHFARLNGGEWLARSAQMGEPRKQHRTDNCWWLQKTRRP